MRKATVSKSKFKSKALEYFRDVEQTRRELIITDRGKPVLKLVPYSDDLAHILRELRSSLLKYKQPEPLDWALRFDEDVAEHIATGHHDGLLGYETLGSDALLAIPTPEHYLPLLYALALQREDEPVEFFNETVQSSISMRSVLIGQA